MKKTKLNKLLILGALLLGNVSQSLANSYYAKMTASVSTGGSTGNGTVYVSNSNNSSGTYGETSEKTIEADSSGGNCTFYLFAQPRDGYELAWWSTTNEGGNDGGVATNGAITVKASTSDNGTLAYTRYAVFKPLPQFKFSAAATSVPAEGGVASASVEETVYGEHYNSTSASTTATFAVTSIARGYYWIGWNDAATGTTQTEQTITPTITNTTAGSTATLTKYAIFGKYADPESIAASDLTINKGDNVTISYTLSPAGCFKEMSFSSADETVATVDADGKVLGVGAGTTTITITANKIDTSATPITKTITVTVKDQCATPVVAFSNVTEIGADVTLTTTSSEATIFYTINGATPTASSTTYSSPFSVNVGDVVRAIAIVPGSALWSPSEVVTKTYTAQKVATPNIVIGGDGTISFSCSEDGTVTYKYCISDDGDCTPTTVWSGTPIAKNLANNEKIIKVIASKDGCIDSDPATKRYTASGISGATVILNDYEDHNWTYYKGVDTSVDGGNYNTNYAGILYSPDPRNVKITYDGGSVSGASAVAVSATESASKFVYYKTIEKVNNAYTYQVISNPFSKRPRTNNTTGTNGFFGFAGWKIVNGGEYIDGYSNGQTLPLDQVITFVNLPYPSVNCTSAEIEFEATWAAATVRTSAPGTSDFTSGTYETNFWVLGANQSSATTFSKNMTVSARYPDGTSSGDYGFSAAITVSSNFTGTVKLEYLNITSSGAINAGGRNLTIGRGIGGTSTRTIYGTNTSSSGMNQVLKVESGTFSSYLGYNANPGTHTRQLIVFGNDYDRAKNDNTKLSFSTNIYGVNSSTVNTSNTNYTKEIYRFIVKSGKYIPNAFTGNDASYSNSFYMLEYSRTNVGLRVLEVEGGEISHIGGGANKREAANQEKVNHIVRMKGGKVYGSIFGGAAQYDLDGSKALIFTGGTIDGWIAGGCNGGASSGSGELNGSIYGKTYIYVGGNTIVGADDSRVINKSKGGYVFGAGCGKDASSNIGMARGGTNVVLADNASVKYGVYGGGAYGYSGDKDDTNGIETSNIYITGGTVEGEYDDTSDAGCPGGVYGGARQNRGGHANIYMTGGLIKGNKGSGLYGGSNKSGTMSGNVKMVITGGQVGTSSATANIHGGGYGSSTVVSGNVDVTLGTRNTTTGETAGNAVIYGDVYGGSALGNVNGTSATTTYKTNVTLNGGTIHGSLYGGALGSSSVAANVYGPVAVKVYGGSVKKTDENGANGSGAVYGCNNINGMPQGTVTVDVYGTDAAPEGEYALFAVYGGGNQAAYTYTETGKIYPQVTIHNCDNSIEYVYGGGNQAAVPGTQVKVYGGDVIGNVFGGGNNADVTTNGTDVDIYGGAILNVFGGNNNGGSVTGAISVTVNAQAEVSGNDPCTMSLGNVYGGGNIASYTGSPVVDFLNGTTTGSVFGGGKGKTAVVVGNPTVNIGDWDDDHEVTIGGSVFGGGDLAAVEGDPTVTIRDCGTTIGGDLYGGGNAAPVYSTNTTMWGGTVKGNVFGGGNGSDASKNAKGAQVGYKRDDTTAGTGDGNAVTNIYGGTVGTWTTVSGVQTCTAGGGVFGGSNTNGNIRGAVTLTMDAKASTETDAEQCDLKVFEVYGAGNEAPFAGAGVTLSLGCITSMDEIYGGAKKADMKGDVDLKITSGHFGKVFGGNNISGKLDGKIVVTVDETGCNPVIIGALYGGGNQAAYSVYGYDTDGTPKESGDAKADPVVNIVSCTRIDTIFGGGLGSTAVMVGNPKIIVQQVAGAYDPDDDDASDGYSANTGKLGIIGTIFGGGNEAEVKGNPEIRIATEDAILRADGTTSLSRKSANISGNVYGGGNKAKVTGDTKIVIGPAKN